MNDEHFSDTDAPETDDQLPADAGHQTDHEAEPEGDTPDPITADDIDWSEAGVEPDGVPSHPGEYGLHGVGDERVDQALRAMIEEGDEQLDDFAAFAHQLQLSHKQFSALVAWYADKNINDGVSWDAAGAALGPDADKMLEAVDRWAQVHLSARTRELVQRAQPSPALLAVLNDAMIATGHLAPGEPDDDATPSDDGVPIATKAQAKALMDSEAYRRGDRKTVQAVRAAFRQMSTARARGFEPK